MTTRPAAVAGTFYPDEPEALRATIVRMLRAAEPAVEPKPKALIAPHAGYVYSGPIAASAYRLLEHHGDQIKRVVLIGPAHSVYLRGLAFPSADAFETPLGDVPVDRDAIERALSLPATGVSDDAHAMEHCVEVHLPFLQSILPNFKLVPIVVGDCPPEDVARVLDLLWNDDALILVSSGLSHSTRTRPLVTWMPRQARRSSPETIGCTARKHAALKRSTA